MRVSELAKELGKSSKDVLDVLQKNNQDVATHSSNVSDAQIGIVKKALGAGASEPKADGAAPKKKSEERRVGKEEAGSGISSAELTAETGSAEAGSTSAGTERFRSGTAGSTAEQTS